MQTSKIDIVEAVGQGYKDFWHYKGRYRVVKGSRASKKSKTTALWFIYNMMKYNGANALVMRKVYRTLKDSCFTELKWAINRLGVDHMWHITLSPLEMTYKPTGQKILFRGLDDPLKNTSLTVEHGHLCWLWIEEAYEITKEDDFNTIDESIRGIVPDYLFKQVTLTFNPWNEKIWLKRRFFDVTSDNILTKTTDYLCNEFLDNADLKLFEDMKLTNPKRYKVAGLGDWGITDGLVYENWEERVFDHTSEEFRKEHPHLISAFGLDFGYTNDPSALFCGLIDKASKEIFVFDEMYEKALTNPMIAEKIKSMGYAKEKILADSAEPKSIQELRVLGLTRVSKCQKGADSIRNGVQAVQDYKIIVHPKCVNFITEISNYTWAKDKFNEATNKPIDDFNHLMDAMRYSSDIFSNNNNWRFAK